MSQVANLKRRQPAPSAPYQPATTGLLSPEVCKGLQLPAALPMIRLLLAGPRALKPALLLKTSNDVLLCLKIQPLQSPLTPPCFLIFLARPSFGPPRLQCSLAGSTSPGPPAWLLPFSPFPLRAVLTGPFPSQHARVCPRLVWFLAHLPPPVASRWAEPCP